MGIVNAGMLAVYDEVEPELRKRVEKWFSTRIPEAGIGCLSMRKNQRLNLPAGNPKVLIFPGETNPSASAFHALVKGIGDFAEEDAEEASSTAGVLLR